MKNNHAIKNERPCSFPDDKLQTDENKMGWVVLPRGYDSMPDPSKVRTAEQEAELKRIEQEAYAKFQKNRNRLHAKMPSNE
jgi:hypothetical protein